MKSNFNSRIIADTLAAKYIKPDDGSPSKKYAKSVPIAWQLYSGTEGWIARQFRVELRVGLRVETY